MNLLARRKNQAVTLNEVFAATVRDEVIFPDVLRENDKP